MTTEPPRLAARPHHGRFPIPFVVHMREDGRPDFRVQHNDRRIECAERRLCQLCGEWLGAGIIAFAGWEMSTRRGVFGEPPMHVECCEYALGICPFLVAGGGARAFSEDERHEYLALQAPTAAPRYIGIYLTKASQVTTVPDDEGSRSVKWKAGPPVQPVRWHDRQAAQ